MPLFVSENNVLLSPGLGEKGILPSKYFHSAFNPKTGDFLYQNKFKYICVYDLECNCTEGDPVIEFNECVELPVVVVDVEKNEVVAEFHKYIRPTLEKTITPFCTSLTGITNEMVLKEGNPTYEEVIPQLHDFLEKLGVFKHEFVFMSCGDFDGKQLKREAERKNMKLPSYLRRWINIKKTFAAASKTFMPKNG